MHQRSSSLGSWMYSGKHLHPLDPVVTGEINSKMAQAEERPDRRRTEKSVNNGDYQKRQSWSRNKRVREKRMREKHSHLGRQLKRLVETGIRKTNLCRGLTGAPEEYRKTPPNCWRRTMITQGKGEVSQNLSFTREEENENIVSEDASGEDSEEDLSASRSGRQYKKQMAILIKRSSVNCISWQTQGI